MKINRIHDLEKYQFLKKYMIEKGYIKKEFLNINAIARDSQLPYSTCRRYCFMILEELNNKKSEI